MEERADPASLPSLERASYLTPTFIQATARWELFEGTPETMKPYLVRQGDYLTKLAGQRGFDAEVVWNDPKNAELKAKRAHMDILVQGDLIYLPDSAARPLRIEKGVTNRYVAAIPRVAITLILRDGARVFAQERYLVRGLGEPVEGTTDAEGKLVLAASIHTREITITLPDQNVTYPLSIGHMDAHQEPSGARQRLENLGYFRTTAQGTPEAVKTGNTITPLQAATARFQRDMGLEPTGELDVATSTELSKAHGC